MVQIADLTKSNVEVRPITHKPETNYTSEPEKELIVQEVSPELVGMADEFNKIPESFKENIYVDYDKNIMDKRAIQKKTCKIKPMPKVIDWNKIKKYGT